MEWLFSRYRNITLLLLVVFAQVILLAFQVKSKSDVLIIRVWAVTAVTPIAQVVEDGRSAVANFVGNYVSLKDVRAQSHKLQSEIDALKLENQSLRTELAMADRVKALSNFQARTPSRMIPARIIGTGNGATNKVAFVDRGSASGVQKGMAVVTPDGIVGKVVAAYPTASQVLMVDDPGFAAGVISQKTRVRGIMRGLGHGKCMVDFVQNEEKVETGEMFYTSGDDRIFPKGMPAGKVTAVSAGANFKSISVDPTGMQAGPEEVLIVIEAIHQPIPEAAAPSPNIYIGPDIAGAAAAQTATEPSPLLTEADRMRERYKAVGEAQNHKFGEGAPGSLPPNFNLPARPAQAPRPAGASAAKPDAGTTEANPPAAPPRPKPRTIEPPQL